MKKKLIVIISALVLGVLLFAGYKTFLAPKGVEGAKKITIEVVNKDQNVDKSFSYNTDHQFLFALLEEHQNELGLTFKKYDFGTMVTGMMGYEAQDSKKEYFHVLVNGVDAVAGPQEIPLMDGDIIRFELRTY